MLGASRSQHVVRVAHRNLRWEVAVDRVTRPMIDWLCTRERAIDHAMEIAEGLLSTPGRERVLVVIESVEHLLTNEGGTVQIAH